MVCLGTWVFELGLFFRSTTRDICAKSDRINSEQCLNAQIIWIIWSIRAYSRKYNVIWGAIYLLNFELRLINDAVNLSVLKPLDLV